MEEIVPNRDLDLHYRSISLKLKNDSDHEALVFTHNLLRVVESVRATEGDGPIQALYWEYGKRIHHDENRSFDPAEALEAAGIDPSHASAFDDPSWDEAVQRETDEGIALAGEDIGTPIISLTYPDGYRASIFGPVMTPIPRGEDAERLWDGMVAVMSVPGFYELKRTRTDGPDTGDRPD